jgi:hypothetical protein
MAVPRAPRAGAFPTGALLALSVALFSHSYMVVSLFTYVGAQVRLRSTSVRPNLDRTLS